METDRCHHLVRIPVDESFSSLNLGSAVMVLLYELRKGLLQGNPESGIKPAILKQKPATSEEVQFFYQHLEQVLKDIDFTDGRSTKLMRKLKRLFNRAQLAHEEVRMLRGILTAVEDAAREPSRKTSKK
jgi:tRNA (cytidine32/uridine32-2'-O)-methyltransferase